MRLILNILWFVFGGFISAALWLLAALVLAITIIGLPFTPAALRMAHFSCAPFGKTLVDRDQGIGSALLNVIWLVFAGWWLALHHIVLAVALALTIIGIPFAFQHLKLAMVSLAPVGKTVVEA
jgi:uncharacterized membrane protein YccF (DUF307 family)